MLRFGPAGPAGLASAVVSRTGYLPVTTRLRFVTFVLKLPVRNPVLVAKQLASLDVLSNGRLISRARGSVQ